MYRVRTEIIIDFIQEMELSKEKLAKICRISEKELEKILNHDKNAHVDKLIEIARVVDVPMAKFFEEY